MLLLITLVLKRLNTFAERQTDAPLSVISASIPSRLCPLLRYYRKQLGTLFDHDTPDVAANIQNSIIHCEFYHSLLPTPPATPIAVRVIINSRESRLISRTRHWLCTSAVDWAQPDLRPVFLNQRSRIYYEDVVLPISVSTCSSQSMQSRFAKPKEGFGVEKHIPVFRHHACRQTSSKRRIAHRNLIPNNRPRQALCMHLHRFWAVLSLNSSSIFSIDGIEVEQC